MGLIAAQINDMSRMEESAVEDLISTLRPLLSELINIVTYVT